jgi:hypothetical protein
MSYPWDYQEQHLMDDTNEAGTAYPSGVPLYISGIHTTQS